MSENYNAYRVKAALRPEWYTHGPVTRFTEDQIHVWEASASGQTLLGKAERTASSDPELLKYLDTLAAEDAEKRFKDIMTGPQENSDG